MISIVSVYNDVYFQINKDGGYLSIPDFNALSRRVELKLQRILKGADEESPAINVQAHEDGIAPFKVPYLKNVVNGYIDKPSDYYLFDELYRINGIRRSEEGDTYKPNQPIELMSSSKFSTRGSTFIPELRPSRKPIAKLITVDGAEKFEFLPKDIGSVQLTYIRYPKFAFITPKIDELYNNEVPDEGKSRDYEWGEWARESIVSMAVDLFSNRTREQSLKQFTAASQPISNRNG